MAVSMQVFQRMGAYAAQVHTNVMLHREAVDAICDEIDSRFPKAQGTPLKVLDLACGGEPISLAAALQRLAPRCFEYTGVDVSADQVEKAKGFVFPTNVVKATVLQGNAFVLSPVLPEGEQYDIVFCGLNTHHGTPEENYFLALELKRVLKPHGVFINHDVFRSPGYPEYERRPDASATGESFIAIPREILGSVVIPDLAVSEYNVKEPAHKSFRDHFLPRYEAALRANGTPDEDVTRMVDHVFQRDFPLSHEEMGRIYRAAGFSCSSTRYEERSVEPLRDVFSTFVAWPAAYAA